MASDPPAPADSPGGSLAPLDRAALERVLARATELQARLADAPDELTEKELLELGTEVGIPAEHLRQALAEEREPLLGKLADVATRAIEKRVLLWHPAYQVKQGDRQ